MRCVFPGLTEGSESLRDATTNVKDANHASKDAECFGHTGMVTEFRLEYDCQEQNAFLGQEAGL